MARTDHRPARRLDELQQLQEDFEAWSGLSAPATSLSDRETAGIALEDIEFAAIALGGEAGEVMNLIKRARLAVWQQGEVELDEVALSREIGDVFAYLLRLTSAVGRRLETIYLETLALNYFRFAGGIQSRTQGHAVTVVGPPGSGKSAVCAALSLQMPTYVELDGNNQYLTRSWSGDTGMALLSQEWFLTQIGRFVRDAPLESSVIVVDQDPIAIGVIYGQILHGEGLLDAHEYDSLLNLTLDIERDLATGRRGRIVVELTASLDTLSRRLASRGPRHDAARARLPELTTRFQELCARRADRVTLSTDDATPEETARAVMGAISRHRNSIR